MTVEARDRGTRTYAEAHAEIMAVADQLMADTLKELDNPDVSDLGRYKLLMRLCLVSCATTSVATPEECAGIRYSEVEKRRIVSHLNTRSRAYQAVQQSIKNGELKEQQVPIVDDK